MTHNKRFSWLHLSDIHVGMSESSYLWNGTEEIINNDLVLLHERTGPWDAIFFTGDLTQCGTENEYGVFEKLLARLLDRIGKLGSNPIFLAVPGNHDLVRPNEDSAVVTALTDLWHKKENIRNLFWTDENSDYRQIMNNAFSNWNHWANKSFVNNKSIVFQNGLLPGDFAASLDLDSLRIGVVGLNTASLQLTPGEYNERLSLHPNQISNLFPKGLNEWEKQHDACFLLSHHPPEWLDSEGRQVFFGEIHTPGRFILHLCGHQHLSENVNKSVGGAESIITHVGQSMFGLEKYGVNGESERLHGYSVGVFNTKIGSDQDN